MSKYAIYYSPKSTPGPVGFFLLRLYEEDASGFKGIMYDKDWTHKFREGDRYSVSKMRKHHIFEAENDESAILFFETMQNEVEYTYIEKDGYSKRCTHI